MSEAPLDPVAANGQAVEPAAAATGEPRHSASPLTFWWKQPAREVSWLDPLLPLQDDLPGGVPPGDLLSVRLRAHGETGAAEFIIDRDGDEAVVASNADGMTAQLRRARMEQPPESELLATSLVADRHDEAYEAAIRAAAVFLAAARPAEEAG